MKTILNREVELKLNNYLEILLKAPKKIPLMCELDKDKIYKKYIEEAYYYVDFIEKGDNVLDLGSGAGFPGIPLSIIFPNSNFYLVDRKFNVCIFLRQIKKELNLNNVFIMNLMAEELKKINLRYNKIVARAFNRVNFILNLANDLLIKDGLVILGKGKDVAKEINSLNNKNFVLFEKKATNFGFLLIFKKIS
ncbi:MAG: 16S rRNA (guanine(527)-N(7))-methyltransferase RsmG [Caldisericia bacterium]|jgi:16S rRNA (guanine527-N7)-methyltransferase|nr:16S rRNA (guanine(527)-N(7))-methyltransferase RsmG [Caldisericia bacterium]